MSNTKYTFNDLLKYIESNIPNGDSKCTSMSQSYHLLTMIETLLSIENGCTNIKCCVEKVRTHHQMYLNDIGSMSTRCILNINCELKEIKHAGIQAAIDIFKKLPLYTKNPLEPLLKLLVKESPYKILVGRIIEEVCKGEHINAKLSIYELEELVK